MSLNTAVVDSTANRSAEPPLDPSLKKVLWVGILSMVAMILDSTVTNVALDTLSKDFAVATSVVQWVSTAYMLALAVTVPVCGWAERRFGSKHLWMASLVAFGAASAGAALAPTMAALIACRALQGAAAGVAMTLVTTVVVRLANGRKLGKLMATMALPMLIVPMVGPAVGGAILAAASWRWIFWINVPLTAVGAVLMAVVMPRDEPSADREPLDALSLLLVGAGSAALLYGLAQVPAAGTFLSAAVWAPAAAGLLALGGFVWRTLARADRPLVELRLFGVPSFTAATVVLVLSGFALYGGTLLMPLFYQQLRGTTVLVAGLMLIPQGLGNLACRGLAGTLTDRFGARWVVAVAAVIGVAGTIPFAFATAATPDWQLAVWQFVRGVGLGGITMPTMVAAYLDVPAEHVASASIITRTLQQLGNAFGAAVAAVVLETVVAATGALAVGFHAAFALVAALTLMVALATPLLAVRRRGANGS
ncbi:MAG: DHA2 family efflux MFS transporter permease subunit [Propionibacteriaceae bacterium]|jgi:EmrB/QacA subfamily drug resistance transporter|nr:DHA2 family efflux MFS transporter permease subunit [Propionibacteriaceae bacterium]